MTDEPTRWLHDYDPSPREPDARCDLCGTLGTIARAQRSDNSSGTDYSHATVRRYCGACWPNAQAQLEEEGVWGWSSRAWHDAEGFLDLIMSEPNGGQPVTPVMLAGLADEMRAIAPDMEGPMPARVQEFIRQHAPPKQPER